MSFNIKFCRISSYPNRQIIKVIAVVLLMASSRSNELRAQDAQLTVHMDQLQNPVANTLYGAFFEEISHGGDGGLYAEMIQNRGFEDSQIPAGCQYTDGYLVPKRTPHFGMANNGVSDWKLPYENKGDFPGWQLWQPAGSIVTATLTANHPLSSASPHSLALSIIQSSGQSKGDVKGDVTSLPTISNSGYHGISVQAGGSYELSFYVYKDKENPYSGSIIAAINTADSQRLASQVLNLHLEGKTNNNNSNNGWQKYTCKFIPEKASDGGYFTLSFKGTGNLQLDFVSLFPTATYKNTANGLRRDLAQKVADLHPAFLRWPGGCYVEGMNIESAFNWKNTIGPLIDRPQTFSPWGYWSTNGFGYDEYLKYCEQIGAKALFVVNVGVSCEMRSGTFITDDSLQPYIQNALDAVEYATGPVDTKWGGLRAKNGHPGPYPLQYVELGNEQAGPRYANRYNRFYAAIHHKYPQIKIIASMGLGDMNHYTTDKMQHLDIADEHAYKALNWSMAHYDHFDHYPRKDYHIYVGEFATNNGVGKGNMGAALSDAVYMMGMEKNGDLVTMSSYAPLLADVHDDNWPVNLINYNSNKSFARISYYALQLFARNRPDFNLRSLLTLKAATINNPPKAPLFGGSVGFATWDTQTEYKDLKITHNNKTLYQSDFKNHKDDWQLLRGDWVLSDSSIAETAQGAQTLAYLKNQHFDTYTLEVKARKISGTNAFIIPFGITDSNSFYRVHIGSWVNSHCTIEKVTGGYDVADLITQQPLARPIINDSWYTIKLQVMADSVACYLNDTLIMTYQEPKKLFALAGLDQQRGDVILKMVNANPKEQKLQINLEGTRRKIKKEASWSLITAPTLAAENSLAAPTKYTTRHKVLDKAGKAFSVTLPAYSISVIRLQQQ